MAKKSKPFHMHALTKASATHLLNAGHITKNKHKTICKDADAGMAATRKPKSAITPTMQQGMPTPDADGDMDGDV